MSLVESKSNLAKLLAQEGIEVVHDPSMSTAAFDPKKRILYLPVLKEMTGDVYDLFVLHEVGHALYTPEDGFHSTPEDKGARYKGFLNVVEDARIEKKVKRKYPGGRANMIRGYRKLLDDDFFGVKHFDANKLSMIDRFNLYFKCGLALDIKFKENEQEFIDRGAKLESWDDVVDLVEDLWAYAEDEEATTDLQEMLYSDDGEYADADDDDIDPELPENPGVCDQQGETEESDEDAPEDAEEGEVGEGEEDENEQHGHEGGSWINEDHSITQESLTDKAFRQREVELVNTSVLGKFHYVNVPDHDPDLFVCDYKTVIDRMIKDAQQIVDSRMARGYYGWGSNMTSFDSLEEFITINKPIVSYMVKEFEMRKSAKMSKRAKISQTGILNTSSLYKYKIDDKIFKQVLHVPEGKNHGLIFYIDFSGSMTGIIGDVIAQTMLMAMFCRQVKIPFRVYGFTNGSEHKLGDLLKDKWNKPGERFGRTAMRKSGEILTYQENDMSFDSSVCLYELFSDRQSSSDFQTVARAMIEYPKYGVSVIPMGGTPLDDAIMNGINLGNKFRKTYNLDILNTIFMTDGDSHSGSRYWKSDADEAIRRSYGQQQYSTFGEYGHYRLGEDTIYIKHKRSNSQVVIPRRGQVRAHHWGWVQTKKLIELYKKATGSNTIYMNVVPRIDVMTGEKANMNWYQLKDDIRKNGWLRSDDPSIDGIFTIKSQAFRIKDDAEKKFDGLSTKDGAKLGQVRNAFKSMNRNRLKQRFLVQNFIEEIA